MKNLQIQLDKLRIGEKAEVISITSSGKEYRRYLDLGLVKGTTVEAVLSSPGGNPLAYLIRGAVLAIRNEDAKNIIVRKIV